MNECHSDLIAKATKQQPNQLFTGSPDPLPLGENCAPGLTWVWRYCTWVIPGGAGRRNEPNQSHFNIPCWRGSADPCLSPKGDQISLPFIFS